MSRAELRVVGDLAAAGVELFMEVDPRTVALSGGSTPKPVYEQLAGTAYPWEDVDAFFGDERCVPADHRDSNFRMANDALLSKVPATVHSMVGCDPDRYERELASVFGDRVPRFDLMLLGIGDDGHTCSLFPGRPELDVTDRFVAYVPEPGQPPEHPRLTLTFPVLDAARMSVFLVKGEGKHGPLRKLLNGDRSIPAGRVRSERVVVLADPAAASAF